MTEISTWAGLATTVGATAAVLLITQYTKGLFPKLNTRLYVLLLSIIITQTTSFILGGTWQDHALMIISAFVVAASAMGSYEVSPFSKMDEEKENANSK